MFEIVTFEMAADTADLKPLLFPDNLVNKSIPHSNQPKMTKSENAVSLLVIIIGRVCRKGRVNMY